MGRKSILKSFSLNFVVQTLQGVQLRYASVSWLTRYCHQTEPGGPTAAQGHSLIAR